MRRHTASLAAAGFAALALTGASMAGRPVVTASLTTCVDGQGALVATVSWQGGRVTDGTFTASDLGGGAQDAVAAWALPHGERSGTQSASLGPNLGYDRITAVLFAGNKDVAVRVLVVSNLPSC